MHIMLIFVVLKFFFSSFSFHFVFTSVEILFYNEYLLTIMGFIIKQSLAPSALAYFASNLKILARVFDALMLTNCCSGLLISTKLNLGSARKSDGIMKN